MPFPPSSSRLPSRSVAARRHRGAVLTAAVATLATAGCVAVVAAAPAGAVSHERAARATSGVSVPSPKVATTTTATTTTATRTATRTATATTTTGTARPQPRWATPTSRHVRTSTTDPLATEVVRLVTVARAAAGCGPVRVERRLATAARLHSEDMARQSYFSHTSLDGRSPWDRIKAQGYTEGSAENIAAGYSTAAAVMDGWMNSPGHRANILDCKNRAIGVGIGRGGSYGTYWTQDFGRV